MCFLDLEKAFGRLRRKDMWKAFDTRGIGEEIFGMIRTLYEENSKCVRINSDNQKNLQQILVSKRVYIEPSVVFACDG